MRKLLFISILAAITLSSFNSYSQISTGCNNADFELGDFTNWSAYTGNYPGTNVVITGTGLVTGRHTIMGPETSPFTTDANTGNNVTVVCNQAGGPMYSCRLGNSSTGAEAERLEYSFLVTQANALFYYRYAVVLQDPGHTATQQPKFEITVINANTGVQLGGQCGQYLVVSSANIPGFSILGQWRYKDWTLVGVDLSAYVGMNVTIRFTTADCSQSGHSGYAYIEAGCAKMQVILGYCAGTNSATATAPPGFTYSWTGGAITTPITTQTLNISNVVPGTVYYCVCTSANGCSVTLSTTMTITSITTNFSYSNHCRQISFNDSSTVVGPGTINHWNWNFGDGTSSTLENPVHVYANPGTYTVTLTSTTDGGCSGTHTTTIHVSASDLQYLNIAVIPLPATICHSSSSTLVAAPSSFGSTPINYLWSGTNGFTSTLNPITVTPGSTSTYYVTAADSYCIDYDSTMITVYPSPNSTATNNGPLCEGSTLVLNATGGSAFSWSGPNSFSSNYQSPTINPITTSSAGQYQVTVTGGYGCTAVATTTVSLFSTTIPPNFAYSDTNNICLSYSGNISLGVTGGGGTSVAWYNSSCEGILIGTGNPLIIPPPTISSLYWANIISTGCSNSTCVSITITVNIPVSPISAFVDRDNLCSNDGGNILLSVSGGLGSVVGWHSGGCSSNFLGYGNPYQTPAPTTTTTYWAKWVYPSCAISSCVSVTINIIPAPVEPQSISIDRDNFCYNDAGNIVLTASGGSGSILRWHSGNCNGNVIGLNNPLYISSPTLSTTYWANWTTTGCAYSTCKSVTVTVIQIPNVGSIAGQSITCSLDSEVYSVTNLSGVSYTWTAPSGWIGTSTSNSITYTVNGSGIIRITPTNSCGNGTPLSKYVTVNTFSTAPVSAIASSSIICLGSSTTIGVSGGTLGTNAIWSWYSGSCGTMAVGTGVFITQTPSVLTTYFVRAENLCSTTTCVSVSIAVFQLPSIPSVITGNTSPVNGNTETYNITNVSGVNYTWSAPSGWIGTSISNSITYTVGAISGILSVIPNNVCGNGIGRSIIIGTGGSQISGTFTYDNSSSTILDSVMVFLMLNGSIVDSIQVDINGNYQFTNVFNGAYNIIATTNKPIGGINVTDAIKTKLHFAGSQYFESSLVLHSGDVNYSYAINPTDAIKITRRFAAADTFFVRGDWVFEKPFGGDTINVSTYMNDTVIVNGANVVQNFKGLCVGDVNKSYSTIPVGAKSAKISLNNNNVIKAKANQYIELPIKVNSNINVGAISLILNYPKHLVSISNVFLMRNAMNNEDVYYNVIGDELRIGWFETNGALQLNNDDVILIITLKTTNNFQQGDIINFSIANNPLCELADENGNPYNNSILNTYSIEYNSSMNVESITNNNEMYIYPNPANSNLNINYNLSNDGVVKISLYNVLGVKLIDVINSLQAKGTYKSNIDISLFPSGVYTIKMTVDGSVIVKRLVISR